MRVERDGEKNRKRGKGERGREKERDICMLFKLREGGRNVYIIGVIESLFCVGFVCWVVDF